MSSPSWRKRRTEWSKQRREGSARRVRRLAPRARYRRPRACLLQSLLAVAEMDAHTARLDNPKCPGNGTRFHDLHKVPQTVKDTLQGRARPNFQYDDPRAPFRRKPQHLTKIPVESDEC